MELSREQKIGVVAVGGVIGAGLGYEYLLKPLFSKGAGTPATSTQAGTIPAVTGLTATTQGSAIVLSWQPVQVQGASVTYAVSAPAISLSQQTAQTTYAVQSFGSAQPGQTVQAQVTAIVGGQQGQTASVTFQVPQVQLPVVAGIKATATSPTAATISWQAVAGIQGVQYALRHVDATGAPVGTNMGNVAPQVTISQTSIQLSQLTAGDALHFEVAAVLGKQIGPWSAVQTLQMPQATTSGGGSTFNYTPPANCASLYNTVLQLGSQMDALKAAHPDCFQGGNAPGSYCAGIVSQWQTLANEQATYAAEYNKCMGFTS